MRPIPVKGFSPATVLVQPASRRAMIAGIESEPNEPDVMRTLFLVFALLALPVAVSSCGSKPENIPAEARAEAKAKWDLLCWTCHGKNGQGDGPTASALAVKPRNHTDKEWQKKTSDQHIETVILKGGAATGLSPLMPPNADLEQKPMVVKALREIVRGWGK